MAESIFREKSLERVKSPESLNDYIKVSNPGVWMLMVAVIVLLLGFCAWGIFGKLESTEKGVAISDGNETCILVSEEIIGKIQNGQVIRIEGVNLTVREVSNQPIVIDDSISEYAKHLGEFSEGEWVFAVYANETIPEGMNVAEIVTESISPMSFIFN